MKRSPEAAALRFKRNFLRAKKLLHSRLPGLTSDEQVVVLRQYGDVLEQVLSLVCETMALGQRRAKGPKK